MHSMCDFQLVIFDCDGVLVDSEVISNAVLALRADGARVCRPRSPNPGATTRGCCSAEIDSRAQAKLGRPLARGLDRTLRARPHRRSRRELCAVPRVAAAVRRIKAAEVRCASPPRASSRRSGCRCG